MRTFVLLPIGTAALAAAAIACELSPAGWRQAASNHEQVTAVSPQLRLREIETLTPPALIAASLYRAEMCDGDYVCREGGAWEPVAAEPAEVQTLTSEGI